jgi:hypothetical protein
MKIWLSSKWNTSIHESVLHLLTPGNNSFLPRFSAKYYRMTRLPILSHNLVEVLMSSKVTTNAAKEWRIISWYPFRLLKKKVYRQKSEQSKIRILRLLIDIISNAEAWQCLNETRRWSCWEGMYLKGVVVICLKALSRNSPGQTEENTRTLSQNR